MRFHDAMVVMMTESLAIRRKSWHFSVFYEYTIGEFLTGYNNEVWIPKVEDYTAEDWIVDTQSYHRSCDESR